PRRFPFAPSCCGSEARAASSPSPPALCFPPRSPLRWFAVLPLGGARSLCRLCCLGGRGARRFRASSGGCPPVAHLEPGILLEGLPACRYQ
ncbi:unnamed protein product, partial [Amoebophrya sp. A120]